MSSHHHHHHHKSESSRKSKESNDASPQPELDDDQQLRLPDDSVLIQFASVDPTIYIDNPENTFGDPFFEETLDEKTQKSMEEILLAYKQLASVNMNLSLEIVKLRVAAGDLKNGDVYNLLDKFYQDVPDPVTVHAPFLNASSLPLFTEKQALHTTIADKLIKLMPSKDYTHSRRAQSYINGYRLQQQEDDEDVDGNGDGDGDDKNNNDNQSDTEIKVGEVGLISKYKKVKKDQNDDDEEEEEVNDEMTTTTSTNNHKQKSNKKKNKRKKTKDSNSNSDI